MLIITLLITASLLVATATYLQSYDYSKRYCEVLLTIKDADAIIRYASNSLYLGLARQYLVVSVLYLALASAILLASVL